MRVSDLTFSTALYGLREHVLSRSDVLSEYKKLRRNFMDRVRRIQKSSTPFSRSEAIPKLPTVGELRAARVEDISHAVADVNYLIRTTGMKQRKKNITNTIAGLQKAGYDFVNEGNLDAFADFMSWFRENAVNQMLDSRDAIVQEFVKERLASGRANPRQKRGWARIFIKWLWDNGYDEAAKSVGGMFFASYRRT